MATLYDDLSLVIIPSGGYKTGKLYSLKPSDGSCYLTCVRPVTKNRINKDGDAEVVEIDTPVIDFTTGVPILKVFSEDTITLPSTGYNAVKTFILGNTAYTYVNGSDYNSYEISVGDYGLIAASNIILDHYQLTSMGVTQTIQG